MRCPLALNHSVMAGHSPSKTGVNVLMPGHPRLSRCTADVDARHKAGHDGACGSSRAATALARGRNEDQARLIPAALSRVASRRRARNMRDFTVLSGILRIAATSRSDLPR